MRTLTGVLVVLVLGVTVGCKDDKPHACDDLYAMLRRLETCADLPGPIGAEKMALKRKTIQMLVEAAKRTNRDYEGVCRDESKVLHEVYARVAPQCLN